jgi:tetratricopeptide (TPR) repeat protein
MKSEPDQIETLFHDALAISSPSERAAFLDQACGVNAQLRERLDALLVAHEDSQITLDRFDEPITASLVGSDIGPYKLLEIIGEGGFGTVYMAQQDQPIRRRVALKIIKLGMDTKAVIARFEAERQALAMMDHPNIARVLDAGATQTGRPYFVMELVRGSTITEYCDKHKMSTAERVELLAQVCRAVQHAHSKGIIHRDLKPSNVLVTVTDDKPVPKVIDFGIAKATQAKLTDQTLFTGYRQLIGTPQYMSPEQADSDGSDVDTRSDVYSLAYDAMRKMIREAEPAKPSTRLNTLDGNSLSTVATNRGTDARKLGQSLHGELDWIVMRALEKERSRRYETAAAMADDLSRHLAGDAVAAGPPGGMYRFKKLVRRHRAAISVAAAVGVVLLLGIAGTTIGLIRETRERHVAEAARTEADKQRHSAEAQQIEADKQRQSAQAVVDFLTHDVLGRASPSVIQDKSVRDVLIKEMLEPAIKTVDERLKDQPLARAAVQQSMGVTLRHLGRLDLALQLAQAALKTRREAWGETDPRTMASAVEVTWDLGLGGRANEAEPIIRRSMEAARLELGEDHPDTLKAMSVYAWVLGRLGRNHEAEQFAKQAFDELTKTKGPDDPATVEAMGYYGMIEVEAGKSGVAAPMLKKEWERERETLGDDDPSTFEILQYYCASLMAIGRTDEAEPLLRESMQRTRRILGDEHPIAMAAMNDYAGMLTNEHRFAEAEPVLRELTDSVRQYWPNNPYFGNMLFAYGKCLAANYKWDDAEVVLRENWAWDKVHPDPRFRVPNSLVYLNQVLKKLHKPTEPLPDSATQPMQNEAPGL